MSNTKTAKVQIKLEATVEIRDKLREISEKTGYSQSLIMTMLIRYYLVSPLDVEHDVRRVLVEIAKKNGNKLRLSERQKKVIKDVTDNLVTDNLI
jgi:hypothetical protein